MSGDPSTQHAEADRDDPRRISLRVFKGATCNALVAAAGQTKASDLAARSGVTEKTAKRDIALLREVGLIEFAGASKKGYYRLKQADAEK